MSVVSISITGDYVKSKKVQHPIGRATRLEVFWEGNLTTQELPASTNYVEVEAPCPNGCTWAIRNATAEDIADGAEEGTLICFLKHKGIDISTFHAAGLEMIIRLPADSKIVISFR